MDIVERLRHTEEHTGTIGKRLIYFQVPVNPDGPEAANVIERLRHEMERIADVSERWPNSLVSQINEIARAALKEGK